MTIKFRVTAPDGQKFYVYELDGKNYVKMSQIIKFCGYQNVGGDSLLRNFIFDNKFNIQKKTVRHRSCYLCELDKVSALVLEYVEQIKTRRINCSHLTEKLEKFQNKGEKLLKWVMTDLLPAVENVDKKNSTKTESAQIKNESKIIKLAQTKDQSIKNDELSKFRKQFCQHQYKSFGVSDLKDIKEYVDLMMETFGVTKNEAAEAAIQLKEEQLNCNLSPLKKLAEKM